MPRKVEPWSSTDRLWPSQKNRISKNWSVFSFEKEPSLENINDHYIGIGLLIIMSWLWCLVCCQDPLCSDLVQLGRKEASIQQDIQGPAFSTRNFMDVTVQHTLLECVQIMLTCVLQQKFSWFSRHKCTCRPIKL